MNGQIRACVVLLDEVRQEKCPVGITPLTQGEITYKEMVDFSGPRRITQHTSAL
jgi:hypothetical protein